MAQAVEEVSVAALPAEQVASVGQMFSVCPPMYSSTPPGRFLRCTNGITHFRLQEPDGASSSGRSRIAVLSHGIGTDMTVYHGSIPDALLKAGFRVLSYDFFGHGWSYANNTFLEYNTDVFLLQVKELLDYVLAPGEPVDLWVGHSTGGIVGTLSVLSNKERPIRALALISPAFWANKPLIARIADKIPNFVHGFIKSVGPLKKLPQDAYLENNDIAFGKKDGTYLFPKQYEVAKENIKEKFKLHPQVTGAIMGISTYFLREDLISSYRGPFKEVVEMQGGQAPAICLLWGKYDVVVPFERAQEVVSWGAPGRVSLVELEAGHESPAEVPEMIANELVKFTSAPISKM